MANDSGWQDILDSDEKILWQGRPDGKVAWKIGHFFTILFGFVFAGFALFWMIMASQAGGGFWMFGLIHFFAGIAIAFGPPFWSAWTRRHTWYTLTDRRAFIATDVPMRGRKLKSYPIDSSTKITHEAGAPGSIFFASEYRRGKNSSYEVPIGFERINDDQAVARQIRDVQRKAS